MRRYRGNSSQDPKLNEGLVASCLISNVNGVFCVGVGFWVYIRRLWLLGLWFRFYSEAPFSDVGAPNRKKVTQNACPTIRALA